MQEVLGQGTWAAVYQPRFGSVLEFMHHHPQEFAQAKVNGADAPARAPTQLRPTRVAITPCAPGYTGALASGVLQALPAACLVCAAGALLLLQALFLHASGSYVGACKVGVLLVPCLLGAQLPGL